MSRDLVCVLLGALLALLLMELGAMCAPVIVVAKAGEPLPMRDVTPGRGE